VLLHKVICYPDTLHAESTNCMQRRSCFAIPPREHKLECKNGGEIKRVCNYPRFLYTQQGIFNHHYEADQIWCDGNLNVRLLNLGLRIRIKMSCRIRIHVFNSVALNFEEEKKTLQTSKLFFFLSFLHFLLRRKTLAN
jgi:hypothetical protein